jgi:lysophospholipase L1-like esterase
VGFCRRTSWLVAVVFSVLLVAAGCGSSGGPPSLAAGQQYYVSLGDSYAAGFQATGPQSAHNTTNGFTYQIVPKAVAKGYHLKLVNFACDGATPYSMLSVPGCPSSSRGPGGQSYDNQTQIAAATTFLRQHQGQIGLVTMSIGLNSFFNCQTGTQPTPCVASASLSVYTNVKNLVGQLRDAAGPGVPIVGTTYPNVILAYYLSKDPQQRQLFIPSVEGWRDHINPALQAAYTPFGATFVNVTAATGGYGPFNASTNLPPYGTVPVPVARVCELTFMCQYSNIHPTTAGYGTIADLVVASLPPAPPVPARS